MYYVKWFYFAVNCTLINHEILNYFIEANNEIIINIDLI